MSNAKIRYRRRRRRDQVLRVLEATVLGTVRNTLGLRACVEYPTPTKNLPVLWLRLHLVHGRVLCDIAEASEECFLAWVLQQGYVERSYQLWLLPGKGSRVEAFLRRHVGRPRLQYYSVVCQVDTRRGVSYTLRPVR